MLIILIFDSKILPTRPIKIMATAFGTLDFSSDSDSGIERSAVKRRKILDWEKLSTFESKAAAESFIKESKQWKINSNYTSDDGTSYLYVCRKAINCSSKRKIFLPTESAEAVVFGTGDQHDHQISKPERGKQTFNVAYLYHC